MNKEFKSNNYFTYLAAFLILIAVSALFLVLFALIMFSFKDSFRFSTVFATLSLAGGCLASAFYTAKKIGNKGLLTGAITGGASFAFITLIALIINSDAMTLNTLFRFIILMLSSLIGGVFGVNSGDNHKYL